MLQLFLIKNKYTHLSLTIVSVIKKRYFLTPK
ncbi:hypothetical protein YPC_2787 [Yersinia pestis biovar Medievalis str. Harbin 35]|nr:hypothetical protein YPC_2787 [Yersinia pestis biovar Medievalis str. Harbin 35]EEO75035.1 hypothetical protein YP516_2920 [Yersinia pestis Nepal516]EEO81867.1 hypothetical protein YPF_1844 [Yersinia pestis biovar Orientalis str. India 195]EEO87767.1 hypothetical protein YPH_3736 [Yersinia pestis biovar Orientalis str. PEXU2]EEO88784.1 hypothetical protein YPS_3633 [Yersinia pestis Pestoides A]